MILRDVSVVVNIGGQNKKSYSEILGRELKSGDTIKIEQTQLAKTSRSLVWCECDICHQPFTRKMNDILQKSRTIDSLTMCGNECKKEYMRQNNPNPPKDKIEVNCHVCNKVKNINESIFKINNFHFCSKKCYAKHKTGVLYKGRKMRIKNIQVQCEICNLTYNMASDITDDKTRFFCSKNCLNKTLQNGKKTARFKYHINKNSGRKESTSEKLVREYLIKHKIDFIQEYSIDDVYFADFYLPEYNLILEVHGDYWHGNPDIKRYEVMKDRKITDNLKKEYIIASDYKFDYLWESDLKMSIDSIGIIIDKIKQESSTTNTPNP